MHHGIALTGLFLLLSSGWAQEAPKNQTKAKELLENLIKEEFKDATKDFTDSVKKLAPPKKLGEIWETIQKQAGKLKKFGRFRMEKKEGLDFVVTTCEFARGRLDMKVAFNKEGKIQAFFFSPAKSVVKSPLPAYAKKDSYKELEVSVGAEGWESPGLLLVPKGKGPFPAVVLLHGSGPQDRDETIGPNKPLRDLAVGMASKGIATLRYEKRTLEHAIKVVSSGAPLTIKEEAIDDALGAVQFLRKQDSIDPKRIFILGHSLGAYVTPQILKLDKTIAGGVLLAANARPLEDLVYEQYRYLYRLDGELSDKDKESLKELKTKVDRVKDPKLDRKTKAKLLPLGLPGEYWVALNQYDQQAVARAVEQPLLVLQGERDYQVTMEDFKIWKKVLAPKENAMLKSYPDLNHLFMPGMGKATPAEYAKPGHVARKVIDDIAEWLQKQK